MARIINASINLAKVGKDKITVTERGKYLNISIVLSDEADRYGYDTAITLNQSKEERDAKEKKVYIGNGKTVWRNDSEPATRANSSNTHIPPMHADDGLPF